MAFWDKLPYPRGKQILLTRSRALYVGLLLLVGDGGAARWSWLCSCAALVRKRM